MFRNHQILLVQLTNSLRNNNLINNSKNQIMGRMGSHSLLNKMIIHIDNQISQHQIWLNNKVAMLQERKRRKMWIMVRFQGLLIC